ncbi:MAG: hypothetical protein U5R06_00395 [candidate division KSB1 bacterium]|nr:hypothetical protein [candidate division KSB1 bacterium]
MYENSLTPNDKVNLYTQFTRTYQSFSRHDIEQREAECLNIQWKAIGLRYTG